MKPDQLTFDLSRRPALGRSAFMVAGSNALAVHQVENWQDWPQRKMALVGPEGSGKTHLVHVWAEMSGARIIQADDLATMEPPLDASVVAVENIEGIRSLPEVKAIEEKLFHLHNALAASGGYLMVTGRNPPAHWRLGLPDLASRMNAAQVAGLDAPDDELLAALLVKLFGDRQLNVAPDLIAYLVPRIDRSFLAAAGIVSRLDEAALALSRPVTRKLASDILSN